MASNRREKFKKIKYVVNVPRTGHDAYNTLNLVSILTVYFLIITLIIYNLNVLKQTGQLIA